MENHSQTENPTDLHFHHIPKKNGNFCFFQPHRMLYMGGKHVYRNLTPGQIRGEEKSCVVSTDQKLPKTSLPACRSNPKIRKNVLGKQ